ncbi:MAG: hypothetical protein MZV64_73660 [Ignavibacteriales bacterium]|nr:hypothetical protein [Ignavibacteriales bacterium]
MRCIGFIDKSHCPEEERPADRLELSLKGQRSRRGSGAPNRWLLVTAGYQEDDGGDVATSEQTPETGCALHTPPRVIAAS